MLPTGEDRPIRDQQIVAEDGWRQHKGQSNQRIEQMSSGKPPMRKRVGGERAEDQHQHGCQSGHTQTQPERKPIHRESFSIIGGRAGARFADHRDFSSGRESTQALMPPIPIDNLAGEIAGRGARRVEYECLVHAHGKSRCNSVLRERGGEQVATLHNPCTAPSAPIRLRPPCRDRRCLCGQSRAPAAEPRI